MLDDVHNNQKLVFFLAFIFILVWLKNNTMLMKAMSPHKDLLIVLDQLLCTIKTSGLSSYHRLHRFSALEIIESI